MPRLIVERLHQLLGYDPETGIFRWRVSCGPAARVGNIAGTINNYGYRTITIDQRMYPAGRLAFFFITGRWPREEIDHINRIRDDDRWCNLREATRTLNRANSCTRNATGFKGVFQEGKKWEARITTPGGGKRYLGRYNTPEEAAAAYERAAIERYGEFARAEAYRPKPLPPTTLKDLGLL